MVVARACGYRGALPSDAAAIIEFIHTATLLHDDVVDGSKLRRGRDTANEVWGNEASVLVGDYVYSRSFEMMVSLESMKIMSVMASATNKIAEGEVLQLLNANDPDTTEERYFEVIYRKTAKLFEAGAQIAAHFGRRFAFRLRPRWRPTAGIWAQPSSWSTTYWITSQTAKNSAKTSATTSRRASRPFLLYMRFARGSEDQRALIRRSIEEGSIDELGRITAAIESTGGLAYTARLARREAALAIDAINVLPDSAYKQALRELAEFRGRTHLLNPAQLCEISPSSGCSSAW